MIIWLNGGFGAGKTTLAEELRRRLPDAVLYDPEEVGLMLWKWLPPGGDFQHLPSWRELVIAAAVSLRRHHADTLIVPMSLIRDAYRDEILGGLANAGEQVLHVFLEVDAGVLQDRLNARVTRPGRTWDQAAREMGMTGVDEIVAAAARQPGGTLMLRSDKLTPAELADAVMAAAGLDRKLPRLVIGRAGLGRVDVDLDDLGAKVGQPATASLDFASQTELTLQCKVILRRKVVEGTHHERGSRR